MSKKQAPEKTLAPSIASLLIASLTIAALFGLISLGITPEQYDIKLGEVAEITITASKDVEDTYTTQEKRDAARRAVQPTYNTDEGAAPQAMERLALAFDRLNTLPALGKDGSGAPRPITQDTIRLAHTALRDPQSSAFALSDSLLAPVIEADEAQLQNLTRVALVKVGELMDGSLLEGQEENAILKLRRELLGERFPESLVDGVCALVRQYLRPNMLLDKETTEQNREKAAEEVEVVVFKKGQNITRNGEIITLSQYQMLEELGILKDHGVDVTLYLGVALLLVLLGMIIGLYLYTFERDIATDPRKMALLCVIALLVVGMSLLSRPFPSMTMPIMLSTITLGAMLTSLLMKSRLAIVTSLAISLLIGLMASSNSDTFTYTMFSVILTSFISTSVCVVIIRGRRQRLSVLIAGVVASGVNALTMLAISLINSANQGGMLGLVGAAAGSGIISAILCLGLQPVLESVFNLDTLAKLTDLSNPNQPLLKRLMIEAPGTYHHSVIVANLAESAANAVGANGLLARVGAFYHDIGKLKRPLYFKENQIHDNPHDRTDPHVSTAILTAHPRDGVEMGQKARLPHAILEIIMQHHGDAPVLFFYDKAVKQGGEVDIQDFRYDGPRPQKPEAAIVMLADTIEAAARAMTDATPEKLGQLIQRLVRSKLEDGQLDRCSLTFRDLNVICEAFLTILSGVYHERIEYPTINIPERNRLKEAELPDESQKEPPAPEAAPTDEPPAEAPAPSASTPDEQIQEDAPQDHDSAEH